MSRLDEECFRNHDRLCTGVDGVSSQALSYELKLTSTIGWDRLSCGGPEQEQSGRSVAYIHEEFKICYLRDIKYTIAVVITRLYVSRISAPV